MLCTFNSLIAIMVRALILFTILAITAKRTSGQAVKLLRGPHYDVALVSDTVSFKIPVILPNDNSFVRLQLVEVSFDNPIRTISSSAFSISVFTDTSKNSFLSVKIFNKPPLPQGKYHLLINVFLEKTTPIAETLAVDLSVKPAILSPIGNLTAFTIKRWPFAENTENEHTTTVFEITHNAIVAPLSIRTLSFLTGQKAKIPGSIEFDSHLLKIDAGGHVNLPYRIKGDLPIGTSTAIFELNAPQLSSPVTFQMEIITRVSRWWIVIMISLGIFFGWLIRVGLEKKLQINRAHKEVLEFYAEIGHMKTSSDDKIYHKELAKIQEKLEYSLYKLKSQEITTALNNARSELTTANIHLNTRYSESRDKITLFSNAISGIWFLPKTVQMIIASSKIELELANDQLAKNSPGNAEILLNQLNLRVASALVPEVSRVKKVFQIVYGKMKQSTLKIFTPQSSILKIAEELAASAEAIPENKFEESPINIRNLLLALSDQRRRTNHLFYKVSIVVSALVDEINSLLKNEGINLKIELEAIKRKVESKFNFESAEDLDLALDMVDTHMAEIHEDIRNVLISCSSNLDVPIDQKQNLTLLIREGRYEEAAKMVAEFKKNIIKEVEIVVNENLVVSSPTEIPEFSDRLKEFILHPMGIYANKMSQIPISPIYSQIQKNIFWTSTIQASLIGLGVVIFGYMLFESKFEGTTNDFIEIFSWAFLLDISLNSVTSIATNVPKTIRP